MKSVGVPRLYAEVVSEFASTGSELIRQSIPERYKGLVPAGTRLLEPGYIPPAREAAVLIVSYFPNASDLDKPGTPAHDRIRDHLEAWANSGSVNDYRASYEDWLANLDRVPFHKQRTKPILDAVGLQNDDIGWIPFVKAPMPAGSSPGDDIIEIDIDATWAQLQLLNPAIVWIQGVKVADRVMGLVKDRITNKVLPPQSVSQYLNGAKLQKERLRITRRLVEYLAETTRH